MADEAAGEKANLHLDEVTGEMVRLFFLPSGQSNIDNCTVRVSSRNVISNENLKRKKKRNLLQHRQRWRSTRQPRRRRVILRPMSVQNSRAAYQRDICNYSHELTKSSSNTSRSDAPKSRSFARSKTPIHIRISSKSPPIYASSSKSTRISSPASTSKMSSVAWVEGYTPSEYPAPNSCSTM